MISFRGTTSSLILLALVPGTCVASCWISGSGESALYRHPSVSNEFDNARFVLIGRATSNRNISTPDDPKGYEWTIYDVEVVQGIKGNPPKTIQLLSENTSSRFSMDADKNYLLFVTHGARTEHAGKEKLPRDYVDNCGHSAPVDGNSRNIRAVERLANHK